MTDATTGGALGDARRAGARAEDPAPEPPTSSARGLPPDAIAAARPHTRAMLERDAASALLGMRVERDEEGIAVVSMTVRDEHLNGFAIAHGGLVFALADTAFAIACNDGAAMTVAQGADVSFLRSARLGETLVATAVRRASAARTGLFDVQVATDAGDLVAEFRGRSFTTSRPMPAS